MHLLSQYALASASKISRPFILEKFFPTSFNKYITLHSTSKPSKSYSFFSEVISIIKSVLDKENIQIIQIGGQSDNKIRGIIDLCGATNINQTAYLIKNSLLHLGIDSFPIHFADFYNKPIVGLYSNNFIGCVEGFFGDKSKQILLEPEVRKQGIKPSFSMDEPYPKQIDSILPEIIAQSVLKLLNLPYSYHYKSLLSL